MRKVKSFKKSIYLSITNFYHMLKYCFTLLLFTIFCTGHSQNKLPNYKLDSTLNDKIKSIKEELIFLDFDYKIYKNDTTPRMWYEAYTALDEEFAKSKFDAKWHHSTEVKYTNSQKFYNKKGKLIKKLWIDKYQDVIATYKYKYNGSKLIEIKEIKDSLEYTYTNFGYDKNKRLITRSELHHGGYDGQLILYDFWSFTYDKIGNLIKTDFFRDNDGLYKTQIIEFKNAKKYKIKEIDYYKNNTEIQQNRSTYIGYNYGKNFKETLYYEGMKDETSELKVDRKLQEYYKNEQLIKAVWTDKEKQIITNYNKLGQKIEVTTTNHLDQDKNRSVTYEYNSKNNITKTIIKDINEIITIEFRYNYDYDDNWTKQIKSVNGKDMFLLKREIKYFD